MKSMVGRWLPLVVLVSFALASGSLATSVRAATPAEVDAAIQKAKAYLRGQQKADGSWPEGAAEKPGREQTGGETAIATYALLAAGDRPQDEHIQKAIAWLEKADMTGTYAVGLRAQVWTYLPPSPKRAAMVARDAKILLGGADRFGRWGYQNDKKGGHNSTSQYGVLGLWACARAGYEVPATFWEACEKGWQDCQNPREGTWKYLSKPPGPGEEKATMTAAGLASLFITQEYLRSNSGIACKGNVSDPRIETSLKWFSNHFDPAKSDGYLFYGIERIGVASGYKYFGTHDWYAAGAEQLVRTQGKDGWWSSHGRIPGTAFGIFFLTRGRATVVMNKLQYEFEPAAGKSTSADNEAHWNQRARDAANIAQWIGQSLERDLNWQIVNLRAGAAADLLDAPILYVSGDQELTRLTPADRQKLKSYVEQGGLILGSADCGNPAFARSFRALAAELFPTYEFRPLPPSHLIQRQPYNSTKWKSKVEVLGLSNGVRELMLLVPKQDLGRSWQMRASQTRPEHFEFAANVFLYAVDKRGLRYKGDTYVLTPDPAAKPRRTIKLARIKYPGNWDPEPAGWRRMATHLLNSFALGLNVDMVELGGGSGGAAAATGAPSKTVARSKAPTTTPIARSLKGYDVAHLTGTSAFKLDAAAAQEIRQFVQSGGTLVVDAAGGSTAFAESAEKELSAIFGADTASQLDQPLPAAHALYTLAASKLDKVAYRDFARERLGQGLNVPHLCGITVNGRTAVLFSREDLSTGLVGQAVDGVAGYTPESALRVMTNVVFYATGEGTKATSRPSYTK